MVTYLGSLVQLCFAEGGKLQTNITGMYEECLQCLGHTGFTPAHSVCAFPVYTAQAPGCSAGELSKVGPGLHALPRSKPLKVQILRYSTKVYTRVGLRFVPFPVPSSSGNQVLGEHTLPRWSSVSYHFPHPSCLVSWVFSESSVSGVLCVSSGELISGSNTLGGCQLSRVPGRLG